MKVYIDIDGVLAENIPPVLDWVRVRTGGEIQLTKEDITSWNHTVGQVPGVSGTNIGDVILDCLQDDLFVVSMLPIEGSVEGVARLDKHFDIEFLTHRPSYCASATMVWLDRHYGIHPCTFAVHAKRKYSGDAFVDDSPVSAREAEQLFVLFDQPWNREADFRFKPYVVRVKTWPEVVEVLESALL